MTPDDAALMAPPERPSREYVSQMLSTLWPAPATVRTGRGRGRPGSRPVATFVALPRPSRPQALVPRAPRAAAAAALRQLSAGSGVTARLRSGALSLFAASGGMRLLPPSFVITSGHDAPADDIGDHLAGGLGRPISLSLKIGPVRAVQKPVLHLIAPSGATVGFAKIGTTEFTAELVRTEAAALRLLGQRSWTTLLVPAVLHHGQWQGHEVLVQEALLGRPWAGERRLLEEAMVELARSQGVVDRPLLRSSWWDDLRTRLDVLPPGSAAELLISAATRVADSRGREVLGFGCWHTDWAPWNMAVKDERVLVWDWEQFETGVPLGLDAIHFRIQQLVVGDAVPPREAYARVLRESRALLAPFGVPADRCALTVGLYLVESVSRYVRDGESGTRLSRVGLWLAETLVDVIGAVELEGSGSDEPDREAARRV